MRPLPEKAVSAVSHEQVLALEKALVAMPQVEITPVHYFAEGLYAREILIPAGTCLTGKIHLAEHVNIISKGRISVLTEDGVKTISAPATLVSKPGIKRAGYAHEDTVWTTIHACEAETVEEAEVALVVGTFEQFELAYGTKEALCHS
ncbi:hypothetical protein GMST_32760 [Geomonas silvestris]|uniref:Uncharacterized protein n=1 Tax=Geomonas silvestris TaxID=2740184 RepID=A0A6V8MLN0_9BACT|nr:hypothetical protein [Geomonas silvestris]GFO60951.1 hypothetical protein GMST_32760 [Geomonas silvestris]